MLRVVVVVVGMMAFGSTARAMPDPPPPEDYVPPPSPEPLEPLPPDLPPPSVAPLPPPASTATRPVYVPVYGPLPAPGLPATPAREHEYGWKIAASDGVALGLVLVAIAISSPTHQDEDSLALSGSDAVALLGFGWWSTLTPLVHLTERNPTGTLLSYGARLALPLAGALVGHSFDAPDSSGDGGALVGICVGALAASVIDIAWLSHRTERGGTLWMPTFTASSNTYRIGLGRSF